MNCIHCHGQMKRSKASFHVDRNGYHLVFDTVPAWVCDQCGEAYFEEREGDTVQSTIKGLDQQAQLLGRRHLRWLYCEIHSQPTHWDSRKRLAFVHVGDEGEPVVIPPQRLQ